MSTSVFKRLTRDNGDYASKECFVGIYVKGRGPCPTVPNHVGFVYVDDRVEGRKVTFYLEFYNSKALNAQPLFGPNEAGEVKKFFHAPMPLDRDASVIVASFLATVFDSEMEIQYALNWLEGLDSFELASGDNPKVILKYRFKSNERGLSCATFVSEILKAIGHNAVNFSTWPCNLPEDIEFRDGKLEEFQKNHSVSQERIAEMRGQRKFYRLRPEEIAAAATYEPRERWPLNHDLTSSLATQLVHCFSSEFSNVSGR